MKRGNAVTVGIIWSAVIFLFSSQAFGSLSVGPPFTVASWANASSVGFHNCNMAYGDGVYAFLYVDRSSGNDRVSISFVNAANGAVTGPFILDAITGTGHGLVSIAYDSTNKHFGALWCQVKDSSHSELLFRYVCKDGSMGTRFVASTAFPLMPSGSSITWAPNLGKYVAVFEYYNGSEWDLQAMSFTGNGTLRTYSATLDSMSGPPPSISSIEKSQFGGPDSFGPRIASDGSGVGVIYHTNTLHYVYLTSGLAIQYGPASITSVSCQQYSFAYNSTNSEFSLLWAKQVQNAAGILFSRLGPSGLLASSAPVPTCYQSAIPSLAWDGSKYIASWHESDGLNWYHRAATLDSSGNIEQGSLITIPFTGGSDTCMVAAYEPNKYIIGRRYGYSVIEARLASTQIMLTTTAIPSDGGRVDPADMTGPYTLGEKVTVTENPSSGWTFSFWSGDIADATYPDYPDLTRIKVTMDRAKAIVANFTNPSWPRMTVAVSPPSSGNATVNGQSSAQAAAGISMNLWTAANTGFIFNSWRNAVGALIGTLPMNRANTYNMPSLDTTVYATFDTAYSVTTTGSPMEGGTVAPTGALWYVANAQVAFTAGAYTGYTFSGWTINGVDAGNANPILVTIDNNKTIYANFTYNGGGTTYTLTTSYTPTDAGTVSPSGTTSYPVGSNVKVTASPLTGYALDSWSGDASGNTNPVTINMSANKIVTANFKKYTGNLQPAITNFKQLSSITKSKASFSLDFTDGDANLSGGAVNLTYQYKSKQKPYSATYTIPAKITSITGTTSGTISFSTKFKSLSARLKSFWMQVNINDKAALKSNTLDLVAKKTMSKRITSRGDDMEPEQ